MEAYALTDIGRVRTMNQDYIYSSPEKVGSLPNLFLVADGMGGQAGSGTDQKGTERGSPYLCGGSGSLHPSASPAADIIWQPQE